MKKIFVVGGGTGGHLFPAIAVAEILQKRNYNVSLITDPRCKKYLKNHESIKSFIIGPSKFTSNLIGKILVISFTLVALIKSFLLLYRTKPALIIGFGGYIAFPPLLVAKLLRIPIMLHEQNCFLGKVNYLFAKTSTTLCLAFKETGNIPKNLPKNKIIVTGNPVRQEILEYNPKIKKRKATKNTFKILITGGSQGASFFSSIIPEAVNLVQKHDASLKLEITQQARLEDIEKLKAAYKKHHIKGNIAEFFYNMPELLYDADLLIGRAGAATIAEIIAVLKPAILVPYPYAAEGHQHLNAMMIHSSGGGLYIDQFDITPEILAATITQMIKDKGILLAMSAALVKLQKDSLNIIADTAEKIIQKFQ
jgi:UDP-N-acetylglucosamine--N-acetylmuramyl-(pentapeptide) pyrophosphoryl-undecaprenol N-acetylglucosamine transferase